MKNHSCAGRTCVFCRALDHSHRWDRKPADTSAKADEQAVRRAREVANATHIELTKNSLAATKLEEMETYVLLDKLTGLYNSRTLVRELEQEISRAQRLKRPLTLCMIAVDGFAEFSKYQGALGADSVLKTIATTLKNTVRDIDVPARHTLEKFAVILPETNIAGAQVAAERIKRKITTALGAGHGLSHKLIVSVSVAAYPLHARKADELIEQASKALNFAMIQGGACIVEATVMH